MGIVRFALKFPHTFYVLAALIVFLGVTAIRGTPTDIFPEIRIPVVTVIWSYTGLSTVELHIPRKVPSLAIPAAAIIFNANGVQVAVVENGAARLRKITVARDLGTEIDALDGVKPGD